MTEQPSIVRYAVEYLTDDVDTVPFPGRPISVSADVDTDLERVVVRLRQRPQPGQTVLVVGAVAPDADAARSVPFATRQVDEIAATFSGQATTLAGDGTVIERIQRIEQTMRTRWQLDSSAPGGGQQLALLERFATETRRGAREQFVTAFVVLVRSLGFDARVATGFVVPPEQLGSLLTITSAHASAWPEVRLEGLGWVAFDPVPPVENSDVDEPPPPPEAQSPAVAQPPIAPPAEPADDIDDEIIDDRAGDDGWRTVRIWLLRVGAVTGISLLPVIVIVGSLLLVKRRRRRRRLQVDDPSMLIRGVWANTTDALVDAGLSIAASWTDDRIAEQAAPHAPAVPHEMRRLAAMSTAVTFGASLVGDDERQQPTGERREAHVTGRDRRDPRPLDASAADPVVVEPSFAETYDPLTGGRVTGCPLGEPVAAQPSASQPPTSSWRSSRFMNLPLALRGSCS